MYKQLAVLIVVVLLFLATPTPARADGVCGILCQWFGFNGGFTDRTQIRQDAETDRQRIQAEADQRIAEINAQAEARKAEALTEVERVKQQQFATEAQRDIEVARVKAAADQYIQSINAMKEQQEALINAETQRSLKALEGQTQLGLEAITEAGQTKRWALTTDLIWSVVLIVGLVFLGWYFLKRQGQPQVIQLLPGLDRPRLGPGYRAQLADRRQRVAQEQGHAHEQ